MVGVSDVVTHYGNEIGCASYSVAILMCKTKDIIAVLAVVQNFCVLVSE